jgi:exopolysaccharide production protein ExoZ
MEPAHTVVGETRLRPAPQAGGRIASLDLLRGLCALAVASYHGLEWAGVAALHNLALYGVYLFFLLSGASMSVAYARRLRHGYPVGKYLLLRYVRLAPLYSAVAIYAAFTHWVGHYSTASVVGRYLLNVTFLFGLTNPGQISLVTGGWSLGIEFVFYFLFPLLLILLSNRAALWIVVAALIAQLVFVNVVLDGATLGSAWNHYTQFGAFAGYFAFGTWIGIRWTDGDIGPSRRQLWSWTAWLVLLGIIGTQSGPTAEQSLTGLRGALLVVGCCALLAVTMRLECPGPLGRVAGWLGEASYPLYLMHPLVFDAFGGLRALAPLRQQRPGAFVVLVVSTSFVLAIVVYRAFEEPILKWGKRRIG